MEVKRMELEEEMIYQDLKDEINQVYQKHRERMGLPETSKPREQLEVLEERKIVTGIIRQIKELKEENEGVKFRGYPYQQGVKNIAIRLEGLL